MDQVLPLIEVRVSESRGEVELSSPQSSSCFRGNGLTTEGNLKVKDLISVGQYETDVVKMGIFFFLSQRTMVSEKCCENILLLRVLLV